MLAEWMPWAAGQDLDGTREFLEQGTRNREEGTEFQFAIAGPDGRICGMTGLHEVRKADERGEIGYWLAAEHQGRGLMTAAVRALVGHGFGEVGLHRIAILAAVGNARSRAIPERLGFAYEGTLREAERVGDRYLDLALYGMLAVDWPPPA
jgi:ribosomal-protein-serine acetyltransferase